MRELAIIRERVAAVLQDLRAGKMIILTDHPDREDEGDLIFPAEMITSEVMNFMIRNGTGIVCLSLLEEKLKQLGLPLMVPVAENTSRCGTPFTISIEARTGVTTGVSAFDRTQTIRVAMQDNAVPDDLARPGHVFPLQAKANGVLERAGHTEGAVDLARLAGFRAAAVLCEVMNPDGTMARGEALINFAKLHQLQMLSIEELIIYRLAQENIIEESVSAALPLDPYGLFKFTVITEKTTHKEHIVLTKELSNPRLPLLVRVHSSCVTGDIFSSQRCDCNKQLHHALRRISEEGGILIYLNQEGRGIGLLNKIKAYALQEKGLDTVEANEALGLPVDARNYSIAASILHQKNIQHIRLLTNNPAKVFDLQKFGVAQVERESMPSFSTEHNSDYLQVKIDKLNHFR